MALVWAASLAGCGASLTPEFTPFAADKGGEPIAGLSAEPSGKASLPQLKGSASKTAKNAADKLTSSATPGNAGYKIGPLDVLDVSVFKVPELSRIAQVGDSGTVNLPLVGEIRAAGRTAQELERDLAAKLGAKYLQSPQVTVLVKEYNSQRVTIEGAVKKPGVYPLRGGTTLLQVIATAEGLQETSDTTVVVFRQVDGKRAAAKFDISEIRGGQAQDPVVQSGDVIVAPTSAMKETFNAIIKVIPLATVFAVL